MRASDQIVLANVWAWLVMHAVLWVIEVTAGPSDLAEMFEETWG